MAKTKPRHFIKQWRKHRGLTQDQLAAMIGITRAYLSYVENGKRRYDQPFLEAAAEAMAVTPADLIMRDPSEPRSIWDIWDNIQPVQRAQALRVLEAFVTRKTGTEG